MLASTFNAISRPDEREALALKYLLAATIALGLVLPALAVDLKTAPGAIFVTEGKRLDESCINRLGFDIGFDINCADHNAEHSHTKIIQMIDGEPAVFHLKATTEDLPSGLTIRGFMREVKFGAYTFRPERACDRQGRVWPLQLYVADGREPGFVGKLIAKLGSLMPQSDVLPMPIIILANGTEVAVATTSTGAPHEDSLCNESSSVWLERQSLPTAN